MLMLKALPEPTLLLRPIPAFLQAALLQKILEGLLDDTAMQRFDALAGKRFLFCTFDKVVNLGMVVASDSIRVCHKPAWEADVTISGDLAALASLCLGLEDPDSLFFSRRLLLTGDTASGLLFKNVLANLDFDLHDALRSRFGIQVAGGMWRLAQLSVTGVERLDADMDRMRSTIIGHLRLTPTSQAQSLRADIARLNSQQEAIQRSLAKLEKRLVHRA